MAGITQLTAMFYLIFHLFWTNISANLEMGQEFWIGASDEMIEGVWTWYTNNKSISSAYRCNKIFTFEARTVFGYSKRQKKTKKKNKKLLIVSTK